MSDKRDLGGKGNSKSRGNSSRGRYNKWRRGFHGNHPHQDETSVNSKITDFLNEIPCPYKSWKLYLPNEAYREHSVMAKNIQTFEKYFTKIKSQDELRILHTRGSFTIDFQEVAKDEIIASNWSTFQNELTDSPENVINCISLAMHQVLGSSFDSEIQSVRVTARIKNYGPLTPFMNFKSSYYGKMVSIRGTVVRVGNCKPICLQMAFACYNCGTIQGFPQPYGKYRVPTSCTDRECKGRKFTPDINSDKILMVDWQNIRLQDTTFDSFNEVGRIPRTIECELTANLVDSCVPGEMVTITGIVKAMSSEDGNPQGVKDNCMHLLYIHVNHVSNDRRNSEPFLNLQAEFTVKELYCIREIQSEKNLFRLLTHSLSPDICGHEMVKAGLLLALFGGNCKHSGDKNSVPVRGDPHVLVVGDPGLGKSKMLRACVNIAPKGVYVCGNTATEAGLTVTVVREGSQPEAALESGALVLADQGCCCIDEFDKMGNQHQALLEAMEQQSISIAKAGMVCNLPTRTSVLAAANPSGGHYNRGKTVAENLRLGSALLSRFDLIFILVDRPNQEFDCRLSDHVLNLHSASTSSGSDRGKLSGTGENSKICQTNDLSLADRLLCKPGKHLDIIPHQLLRKYICYARHYVKPVLSEEAKTVIQTFYLELRKTHHSQDSTPITTRQLESLIRLTEARARMELREEATGDDARDIVDIMRHSMIDTYIDSSGQLDFQRSQFGVGSSCRGMSKKFIAELNKVSELTGTSLFTADQLKNIAKDMKLNIADFGDFICSLNNQNFLLKKGVRLYELLATSI